MTLTNKQIKWKKRSWLLFRLKGFYISTFLKDVEITDVERRKLKEIDFLIKSIIDDFTISSQVLGFNAYHRCWCGRKAKFIRNEKYYCDKHINE